MRLIYRNPFARYDLLCETVQVPLCGLPHNCENCGGKGKIHKHHRALKRYYVNRDSIANTNQPLANGKLFCGVDCFRSYTGN